MHEFISGNQKLKTWPSFSMRKIDMIPVSPNSSSPFLSSTTFLFQEIMKQLLQIIVMRR